MIDSTTDVPLPRRSVIRVPDSASFPLTDLPPLHLAQIAAFLTTAARTLRSRPPASMDGCLNRGNCRQDLPLAQAAQHPCCLLCALDMAVIRHLPDNANTATACTIVQVGTLAKQFAIDTIEANPHHGGEVTVLEHLTVLIRTNALPTLPTV